jgi:CheY-like chemotaxis protein
LKLMQNIFPSSVQYNTSVGGNNRPKEGILLIDDDRQRLERTQSLLRQHFIVYSVNNDDEALDFLNHSIKKADNANEICLIIITIDVSGDDINGWGFLNILWNTDELKDIPVVALASSFSLKLAKAEIWEVIKCARYIDSGINVTCCFFCTYRRDFRT